MSDGITDGYRMKQEAEAALEAKGWIRHRVGTSASLWEDPTEPGSMHWLQDAERIQEERESAVKEVMET